MFGGAFIRPGERRPGLIGEQSRNYQPPPLVTKRRMKRSCSEWELIFTSLSMDASNEKIVRLDIFRMVSIVGPSRQ